MEFFNDTSAEGDLFRNLLPDDDLMLAVVVAKESYRITPTGELALDTARPFRILLEPAAHPFGELPTDMVPWKRATDLLVMGTARAPGARAVKEMTVSVRVGAFSRELVVVGDRQWTHTRDGLRAGQPTPFLEMPLTLARAYGGKARARGALVPDGANPAGKGFLLDELEAPGAPLPNLEDPAERIVRWTDRPTPLTFTALPLDSGLRAEEMLSADPMTGEVSPSETCWNAAHPKLRPPALAVGAEVVITGMTKDAPLCFSLPSRRMEVHVWLADRRYAFPLRSDTLAVLVDERRLYLVHRCHFTYSVRAGEARLARLREVPPAEGSRAA